MISKTELSARLRAFRNKLSEEDQKELDILMKEFGFQSAIYAARHIVDLYDDVWHDLAAKLFGTRQ